MVSWLTLLFAIGDVHGCAAELRLLLNKLPRSSETTIVFLGDYVDRGPSSREVIETVLEVGQQHKVVALMGNHESMFLDYLKDPSSGPAGSFIYNGGSATLQSYVDEHGEIVIPPSHIEFLHSLALIHQTEHNVFVHAGLPPKRLDRLDPKRDAATLLWTRGKFLTSDYDWGKVVVHGHTPVDQVTVRPNRINIDTGCVFDRRLTALALPGEIRFSVHRLRQQARTVLQDPSGRRAAYRFRGEVPVQLDRGGRTLDFVTIDYSELGMYLRATPASEPYRLDDDERIEGVVGPDDHSRVAFVGVVVRRRFDDNGSHYGVKILSTGPVVPREAAAAATPAPGAPPRDEP